MSRDLLLGLDLGGSGIRCLLVDPSTATSRVASRPWRFTPDPATPMGTAFDPDEAWQQLAAAVAEVIARAGATASDVAGIGVTSMRHGSVVVADDGTPLLAAPNRDARGALAMLGLAQSHGETLHRRTGHWPNSILPVGRLRWMATEQPEVFARAAAHLSLDDWVALRLCGERATDPSQAGETPVLDLATRDWADDLIEAMELPRHLFPPVLEPGTRLGSLRADAATALGLTEGTPVAVGGADTQCGLLGAGVLEVGALGIVAGSSTPLQRVLDTPRIDEAARLWTSHHLVPGRYTLESNAGGVGEAVAWIAGLLYGHTAWPVVHLLDEAARSEPGALGMLSTVGAQLMNARELVLPVGNLTFSPLLAADDPQRRRHAARAVCEGIAYALRGNAEQIAEVSGALPDTLRVTGGLSRSAFATQLIADVMNRRVEVPAVPEATALGAAICAGVAAGRFADLAEGAAALVRIARSHAPDASRAETYEALYPEWNDLRRQRAGADAGAAGIAMRHLLPAASAGADAAPAFRPRILVASDMDEASLERLRGLGEVEYASFRQAMRMLTGAKLVEALRGVQVFVTEIDVVDAEALAACDDLRLIAVCRGDAVNVDLDACTTLGIPVTHTPGRNADAVADLAVGFLLMLLRKLPQANDFLREPGEAGDMARMGKAFGTLQGRELWEKRIGLVGLGAVGRKVVQRLGGFGARCLVHDPFLSDDAVRLAGAEPVGLDELLERSDAVSLHAAVTEESRGLIGAAELARMRPGSFLVNTARAALVDEDALVDALERGHLGGAALDVFAVEPPGSDHPLLALPNVVAAPHVGGNTVDVAAHQGRIVCEELERLLHGEAPRFLLNPETLEHFSWTAPRTPPPTGWLEARGERAGPAVTDLQKEKKPQRPRRDAASPAPDLAADEATADVDVAGVRARFEAVLAAFAARVRRDEGLLRSAAGAGDVVLHFVVPDLGSEMHLGFERGAALADLGPPPSPAPVQLKLRARLFDGMFSGRANAMEAAMNGELSFSGDAAKGMALNQIQDDLVRLYGEARQEAGDPGDLTALPEPAASTRAPAPAEAAADDVRQAIVEITRELFAAQLITATGGNVSARCDDAPDQAWITPSQLFKGDLSPDVLVRIDMDGRAVEDGGRSPSSEALMHTAVLRARPEAKAVIHCHAPNATILANTGLPFLPISTEAAFFKDIGRIPFVMPGTTELAEAVVAAMGEGWAVLMQNHGLLVAGRSLRRAADMAEIIERTCAVILGCRAVGVDPPTLPDETVEMLSKYGDLMA